MKSIKSDTMEAIRKIIKVGPSSLAVVLPKEWIDKNYLQQGSPVTLKTYGSILIITPSASSTEKSDRKYIKIDYNRLVKDGIDVQSTILCGLITGVNGINIKNSNKKVEKEIASIYGSLLDIDIDEKNNIGVRFIIDQTIYNDELLLKHMLSVITQLVDAISLHILEGQELDNIINLVSLELKKYGYVLARRLLTNYKDVDPSYIINFSTGLALGLIGELLLVDAISVKNKEINAEDTTILVEILDAIKQVLQEALGGLIYKSSSRAKKAKASFEKLKKAMKSIRFYSTVSNDTIEHISRLDAVTRLLNKLVDMSLCQTFYMLSQSDDTKNR